MMSEDIEQVVARFVLKRATLEDLIQAAAAVLTAGYASSAFAELARVHRDYDEVAKLFEVGLREAGVPIPSKEEAVVRLSKGVAWKIIRGEVTPLDGAEEIRLLNLQSEVHIVALEPFRHASFEANPEETDHELKKYYDDMVMEAAQRLVGRN